ncbi:MAG: FlgD immunoglobulin-like domain containing protein [Candidatus Zixiibacteriota bacterium]
MRSLRGLPPIVCLVLGCLALGYFATGAEPANGDLVIDRFPADVGNSWDYRRTFYIVMHDTSAGDSLEFLVIDSLHAEFLSVDVLDGWKCYKYSSRLFEAGNVYSDIVWYAHPDSAFLEVAYTPPTHAGPPWKDSMNFGFGGRYFTSLEEFRLYLYQMRTSRFADTYAETTYWKPPKKLFVFPLMVGMQWISMTEPWKEEREVMGEEAVEVPAGHFHTLRIEMRPDMESFWLYQWLSELGVIKDSAYFDTTEATNEFGDTVGYVLGYDKYELVRAGQTGVEDESSENVRPLAFSLSQNHSNPFNPSTVIPFSLSVVRPTYTTLRIYNILGEEVRTLLDEQRGAGNYQVVWDGKDDRGKEVASGIYLYRLSVGEFTGCKKMLLMK